MTSTYEKDFQTLKEILKKFREIGWPTDDYDIIISQKVHDIGMAIIGQCYLFEDRFPKVTVTDENELSLVWEDNNFLVRSVCIN